MNLARFLNLIQAHKDHPQTQAKTQILGLILHSWISC